MHGKEKDQENIGGMTVNERLAYFGLFPRFDAAVRSGDLAAVVKVLTDARFTEAQATQTARTVLANPKHYGF